MSTGPALDPPTIPFSTAVAALSSVAEPQAAPKADSPLDDRINAVLRGAVEGLGCSACEVRLIDDQATEMRTSHSQAATEWEFRPTPATPLAEATGELAAMSGSAVVLENDRTLEDWDVDRPVGAAICVPVSSDTTIHGAMWFYSNEPRKFDRGQLQLAEIIAGRIAVEFERHWLLEQERYRQTTRRRPRGRRAAAPVPPRTAPVSDLATPEPKLAPPADKVEIAGTTDSKVNALHIERHLDDGRVLLAAAAVLDTPGMTTDDAAAVEQAITESINNEANTAKDAGSLLTAVGRQVWQQTTGGDAASVAIALVDQESGEATLALAGDAAALRVQASRRTPLATDLPPIGWDDQANYPTTRVKLAVRERLILAIGNPRMTGDATGEQMAAAFKTAGVNDHRRMTAEETLARAMAAPKAEDTPLLAASVLRRR